jgi:di/tripeptidase
MFKRVTNRFLKYIMSVKPLKYELINVLDDIARFYSPSGHAENVIGYSYKMLIEAGFSVSIDAAQNVIATRGKASETDTLVCINAHTDTVQKETDTNIGNVVFYDWVRDTFHTNGRAMIGGDDKCGIAAGLVLACYTDLPMKILFTSDEEIGSVGAEALDPKELDDVAFTITMDRMGGHDLISNYCGLTLAPAKFVKKFIEISKSVGAEFEETFGTYADTYVLAGYKPAVNLSSGYYNPHTSKDFIYVEELYRVMLSVKNAIENKQLLEEAIASAPKNWQKREYASRGYNTQYYSFGNSGHYSSDKWLSRKQRRTMQKCKIKYGSEYGNGKKRKIPKHDPDNIASVDELIEFYADGQIYDDEWDSMLTEGVLSKQEYHIGIDEKIARESYAHTFESNQMDARSRWEEEEEGFDKEEEEDEERKISVMRAFQNEYDTERDTTFGRDELEELGIRSGYLKDTIED